ncbi:MAG: helix-turn-helix transcriptional regulator [Dehalococcoidia bacterium]|nr:helix-turn-helix transcriptional regulator [Dehalococcoidia bacterium]
MDNMSLTESSGNVFADLGIENPEEALAKAKLARAISVIITRRDLTQTQAAAVLGVDQPKVSSLMRGRLSGFSIDRLLRFLLALDRDVDILIKAKPPNSARGRLDVVAVPRASDTREVSKLA